MNLLWLIVSGEFGERLSQDLRAAGYAITEVASTGDFLNFGNMILLLSVEKREVDAATALIRQKMNEYRHLDAFDQDALPGSDIAIEEIHHNKKKDAPSGTAKTLCDILHVPYSSAVSMRIGTVPGEHRICFALEDEVIEIIHRAFSKKIFAIGAIEAGKSMIKID